MLVKSSMTSFLEFELGFMNSEAPESRQDFSLICFVSIAIVLTLYKFNILSIWIPNPPPAPITPTLSVMPILAFLITLRGVAIASEIIPVSIGFSLYLIDKGIGIKFLAGREMYSA